MTADLQALRFVERARVYKKDRLAGVLVRRTDGVAFSYLPGYLDEGGPAVASTLPPSRDTVVTMAGALPPFFSGLLPEGRRLTALRTAVKTSPDDELSLLLAVGGDTVGDVRVLPEDAEPDELEPLVRVSDWSEASFAELFAAATGTTEIDRIAIPGVQEKVSAAMITVPVAGQSERFILKLDPPEYPHLVVNEAFMLTAARRSGLRTVDAQVVTDRDGRSGLLVRRFDRTGDGRLLGVEDGCQALGRYPSAKYAVTTEEVCRALAAITDAPVVTGRQLLRWVTFAYLSCDGDLHAKNLAVGERTDGSWQVSPVYDIPASYPYGDYTMALSINGKRREDISRKDLLALGGALDVPARATAKAIDDILARLDAWLPQLSELPFAVAVQRKWRRAIEYRARQLAASLS
ncbi:MAG TPA: HipA domain-containing protein [Jiangellales bacterium]|nr:HipA domain-containing protein [Jiangellales bacterium]